MFCLMGSPTLSVNRANLLKAHRAAVNSWGLTGLGAARVSPGQGRCVPQALHDESWDLMQAGVMVALMRRRWNSRVFFAAPKWWRSGLRFACRSTSSAPVQLHGQPTMPFIRPTSPGAGPGYLALVPTAKIQCINQLFSCGHNCCNGSTGPLCLRAVPCPVVRREKPAEPR